MTEPTSSPEQADAEPPSRPMRRIRLKWEGVEDAPLIFANSAMVQHSDREFIVTFGQVHPPVVLQESELAAVQSVAARAAVRVVMTPAQAKELMRFLETTCKHFDQRGATGRSEGETEKTDG